jgi:ATP-dependent DNA ligase
MRTCRWSFRHRGNIRAREAIALSSCPRAFPSGFIEWCQPSKAARPPSGPLWVHEKHDGYRLMVRRDGSRVRCFTRNGQDWADRFRAMVEAANRIKATSFLIDGEAVIARDDGTVGLPCAAEQAARP